MINFFSLFPEHHDLKALGHLKAKAAADADGAVTVDRRFGHDLHKLERGHGDEGGGGRPLSRRRLPLLQSLELLSMSERGRGTVRRSGGRARH